jgi:hypothetical protein
MTSAPTTTSSAACRSLPVEHGQRYASLVGTFLDLNLINHPIIRFGPTAQLRFGRSDVSSRAVRRLPSISKTIEAGLKLTGAHGGASTVKKGPHRIGDSLGKLLVNRQLAAR